MDVEVVGSVGEVNRTLAKPRPATEMYATAARPNNPATMVRARS